MRFYDYLVLASGPSALGMARELGWHGICMAGDRASPPPEGAKIDLTPGLVINAKGPEALGKELASSRRSFEIIITRCATEEACRAAAEAPGADIIMPSESCRMDHVTARMARKNCTAIGFEFAQLLHSSGEERCRRLSAMLEAARIVRGVKAPFALVSGAVTEWDLRAPSELEAFGRVLGFGTPEIRTALSGRLAGRNRKRLGGGWVQPGVEVE